MSKVKQVRLIGFGGQGVVLAGTILAHAAIKDGRWVAGSSAYGAQARGGTARYDVIVAEDAIKFPHMISTDILIAFSQKAYEESLGQLSEQGALVIYDELLVKPQVLKQVTQISVPATDKALQDLNNKQAANMVMLAAAAALTGLASQSALVKALEENSAERFREINLKALELGQRIGMEIKKREK
ncbi:MAG: 2-oxoacid:ferredoxin oxidoreductase subunit gamma [Desulfobacteraceae bacterium]|nr:MAG: 2-oxoacid:ferredoxin oxidoreductase subunit gamma [Desulfobacteraceae bacterium]